jgi:hypothetical protein
MTVTPPSPTPTKPYKAVATGIGTFLIALYFQLEGRRETLDTLTVSEWLLTLLGAFVVAAVTWGVPNPAKVR